MLCIKPPAQHSASGKRGNRVTENIIILFIILLFFAPMFISILTVGLIFSEIKRVEEKFNLLFDIKKVPNNRLIDNENHNEKN